MGAGLIVVAAVAVAVDGNFMGSFGGRAEVGHLSQSGCSSCWRLRLVGV